MRIVCQFSCGAASAVATKLAISEHPQVEIINAFLKEEHPDNRRFLSDCEGWFGQPVTTLRDDKYNASAYEVFRRKKFIKSQSGAPCSFRLKKKMLDAWKQPGDVMVMGYTIEEKDRYETFCERNPTLKVDAPLIRHELEKSDCLAIIENAGIEIPYMYKIGYHNANCIGCPKGGKGYWNKIKIDFPETFNAMAEIQEDLGEGSYFWPALTGDNKRISLRELPPTAGNHNSEPDITCSFYCVMASDFVGNQELPEA